MNSIVRLPADDPGRLVELAVPGTFLQVVRAPVAGVEIATRASDSPIRLGSGQAWCRDAPWDTIYLTWTAAPGEFIELFVGDGERLEAGARGLLFNQDGAQLVALYDRLDHLLDSILPFSVDPATGDHHALAGDAAGRLKLAATGTEANAGDNLAVGDGTELPAVEIAALPHVTIFGTTDTAVDFSIQVSQDGLTFYTIDTLSVGVAGHFGQSYDIAARWVRLVAEGAATATVTIAGKS